MTGGQGLHLYVYAAPQGLAGIPEGVYRYHPEPHQLSLITGRLSENLKQCYTPFNRKQAGAAKFALFLVALPGQNRYLALLEAGYIGQLLLTRQAEFGLGLCPIGAMLFDKIRADFQLSAGDELIHSFVGGCYQQELPKDWPYLTAPQPVSVAQVKEATSARQDFAIIGISGRYPGAANLDAYADNLRSGRCTFSQVVFADAQQYYRRGGSDDSPPGQLPTHTGGFLADIDCFDTALFQISPAEAKTLDPQERLLLEVVWECLEQAAYTAADLNRAGKVGVFIGAMLDDFHHHDTMASQIPPTLPATSVRSSMANRISHFFDFNGPSITLDTSCSSALTAIHYACLSISNGECAAAIVGGVNIMSHPYHQGVLAALGLLSKDGLCRPLGAEANGWVAGEGVGAILITSRSRAEHSDDTILALIKGTNISHGGRTSRYGTPNPDAHSAAITDTLHRAAVSADSISYIEAAAPGASLADAAEMAALKAVFQHDRDTPVYLGSVKANIGHLESASALSQLTKVLLQMQHRQLFPSLGSTPPNPLLQLADSGLAIVDTLRPWHTPDHSPRRALINAFGATGSSAHSVVEEYPHPVLGDYDAPVLIVLSAATEAQLMALADRLRTFLADRGSNLPRLVDVAYSLQIGRTAMRQRLAMVVATPVDLQDKLNAYLKQVWPISGVFRGQADGDEAAAQEPDKPLDLLAIAEQWVLGRNFAWQQVASCKGRRIGLPTYPFAKVKLGLEAADAPPVAAEAPTKTSSSAPIDLVDVERYLLGVFSEATAIPVAQLNVHAGFGQYGISSYLINKMNARLAKDFGEVSKILFFEYPTLHDLAVYFLDHYAGQCAALSASTLPASNIRPEEEDIAIIGLSGRYPKADNVAAFWENLKNGVDCITEIPAERWTATDNTSRWGGFIDGVAEFDPLFFNISPREAERMDPQERLFLATVWHTFEDAGYSRQSLQTHFSGNVGVFVGVMYGEYQLFAQHTGHTGGGTLASLYGSIANRVSYLFDLHGPSMAIDTLCSSSLTALHQAVASIKRGECAAAVVGGVNLSLHPNKYRLHAQLGMSSSDGRCRSFGVGGDGFVAGEGVGAVLIKPLSQAVLAGDHIYGVIKATAINHDGKTHGYTVPNPNAQAAMIAAAIKAAHIDPRTIGYIEAHGTGTALGDPIEINGLSKAFGKMVDTQFCALGSVKSNIGHLEAAAGIAGLTKILLQMHHRQVVPSLHSQTLNPNINFSDSPFYVPQTLTAWPKPIVDGKEYPRVACLSSFGAGGANAHLVLAEYPTEADLEAVDDLQACLLVLSARQASQLHEVAAHLLAFVRQPPAPFSLRNLVYTLQVGREALAHRLAFIVSSVAELEVRLQAIVQGDSGQSGIYLGVVDTDNLNPQPLSLTAGQHNYAEFAQWLRAWVHGQAIDWRSLYQHPEPLRLSLPVYPFAKEHYWLPLPESGKPETALPQPVSKPSLSGASSVEQGIGLGLQTLVGKVLHIPVAQIGLATNLADFGFESVSLAEFAGLVNKQYGVGISPAVFFVHTTLAQLARHLLAAYPTQMPVLAQDSLSDTPPPA
ncbi:MAG: beta-ketoacyl synthase N-terminal-like domain-containing protein, partial [Methylovulum sp.]|nr:beta-ketoacyl synthase N-terminal-like domain-containing protein [Methylovulum sp.]